MAGYIGSKAVNLSTTGADINGNANIDGTLTVDSNVGIGTSTPRTGLHLYGAGQTNSAISDAGSLGAFLRVSDTGAAGGAGGGVVFGTNASEADGFAGFAAIKGLLSNGNDRTIGALAFSMRASTTDTALTERMRLTSDGTLLVGKTTTSSDPDTGMVLQANGIFKSTSDGNRAGDFNRGTSDGEIVRFSKDGTSVGSIANNGSLLQLASASGGGIFLADNGTNVAGFANGENAFRPASDNAVNLGKDNRRFQNLYLSGGVYLGGTGSGNHLDDYEFGTWTPVYLGLTSNPTCTYDIQEGHYTKVGNLVTCTGRIRTDAVSGGSGVLALGGLPFSSKNVTANGSSGTLQVGKYLTFKSGQFAPKMGFVQDASNYCTLLYEANDNSAGNCDVAALNNTANDNDLHFSITYLSA